VKVIEGRGIRKPKPPNPPKGGFSNAQSPCSTSLRCLAMGKCVGAEAI